MSALVLGILHSNRRAIREVLTSGNLIHLRSVRLEIFDCNLGFSKLSLQFVVDLFTILRILEQSLGRLIRAFAKLQARIMRFLQDVRIPRQIDCIRNRCHEVRIASLRIIGSRIVHAIKQLIVEMSVLAARDIGESLRSEVEVVGRNTVDLDIIIIKMDARLGFGMAGFRIRVRIDTGLDDLCQSVPTDKQQDGGAASCHATECSKEFCAHGGHLLFRTYGVSQ